MKHHKARMNTLALAPIIAVAASGTIALAQAAGVCWERKATGFTITTDDACFTYTVCPTGYLCQRGGNGLPDPIVLRKLPCSTFTGGSGTPPNCSGGVRLTGSTSMTPTPVPDQQCTDNCLQGIE